MSRGKSGTKSKIIKNKAKQERSAAMRQFTRTKALNAITAENCTEKRFSEHRNYHVRMRAWNLQGRPQGATENEQKEIIERLTKGREKEAADKVAALFAPVVE